MRAITCYACYVQWTVHGQEAHTVDDDTTHTERCSKIWPSTFITAPVLLCLTSGSLFFLLLAKLRFVTMYNYELKRSVQKSTIDPSCDTIISKFKQAGSHSITQFLGTHLKGHFHCHVFV